MPEEDVMKQTIEAALPAAESTARLSDTNQLNKPGEQALAALLELVRQDIARAPHAAERDRR